MARARKPQNNKSNVVSMPPEDAGSVAVEEAEPETPFDPPAAPTSAPAPHAPPTRRNMSFWDRVAAIPKLDWGTRAFVYVYCLEPICNLKLGGEKKYLVRLEQPITDENALMIDYGSGKYRLQLVHRKPAADKQDAIDTLEIEIYNPKYPPKIPRAVWMNDPRNERWSALLPKEEVPAPPTGLGTLTEAFKTFSDIRRDVREEIAPPPPPPPAPPVDRVEEFSKMLHLAKEMMPAPPAAATDNKVLDTVVALMMKQLDASQQETRELRKELRDVMAAKQQPNDSLESMLVKAKTIIPELKGLFDIGGDKITEVVHGRKREWWQELLISAAPQLTPGLNSLMGAAAGYFLAPKGPGLGQPPQQQVNGGQQQPQLPAPQPQADPLQPLKSKVGNFLQVNITKLQRDFEAFVMGKPSDPDNPEAGIVDGTDFAMWVQEANPEILKDIRTLGADNITAMFRQSPYWPAIQPHAEKFSTFLYQVLAFVPDEEEPPAVEGSAVDLTEGDE